MTWYNWVGWIGIALAVFFGLPAFISVADVGNLDEYGMYFWAEVWVLGVGALLGAFICLAAA